MNGSSENSSATLENDNSGQSTCVVVEDQNCQSQSSHVGNYVMCSGDIVRLKHRGKRRFMVLRYTARHSTTPTKCHHQEDTYTTQYILDYYESRKKYQRGAAPSGTFDMNRIIHVSRCAWKGQRYSLSVCLENDAIFLKFDSESEMDTWRGHFMHIFNACRQSGWPTLLHCFHVVVKNKDLGSTLPGLSFNGRKGPVYCRLCLTKKSVLVVRSSLSQPNVCLPYKCIRRCLYGSNTVQLHLGRFSPFGQGELHFQAFDESETKEIHDEIMALFKDIGSRDVDDVKPTHHYHKGPRLTRGHSGKSESENPHYLYEYDSLSSCAENAISLRSNYPGSRSNSLYVGGSHAPSIASRHISVNSECSLSSQNDLVKGSGKDDDADYCQMMQFPAARCSNRSLASSGLYKSYHSSEQGTTPSSSNPGLSDGDLASLNGVSNSLSEDSRLDRLSNASSQDFPFGRTFSLGSRPPRVAPPVDDPGADRQIFVEHSLAMRPRTTSDATQRFRQGLRQFRPRASSHGTKKQLQESASVVDSKHSQQSIPELKEGSAEDAYVSMNFAARSTDEFAPCSSCRRNSEAHVDPYCWQTPLRAPCEPDDYAVMNLPSRTSGPVGT